ncbi:MAG: sulfite exporter TauE/SafE family protein [Candidatus Eremiobacteraeota bacterium]|nr:sulfite exporter TauE/SafE family protein [Candidatus Eremiobacteraeota bacterium]
MGASVIGSIVGLGGGFIAVPILRVFFHLAPGVAAGASLVLVFANTLSASVQFARQKRVAFDLAIPIALCAIPGSIFGAILSAHVSGPVFDTAYAIFLSAVAIDVLRRTVRKTTQPSRTELALRKPRWYFILLAGLVVGFISSLFGIGGGVVVIPLLLFATSEEMHVVTATSTAIIAMTAPVGIITQGFQHDLVWPICIALAAAGLVGGQLGALVAQRISSSQLSVFLAFMMVLAAAGMVLRNVL